MHELVIVFLRSAWMCLILCKECNPILHSIEVAELSYASKEALNSLLEITLVLLLQQYVSKQV